MTPALSPVPVWRIPPRAPQPFDVIETRYSPTLKAWVPILTAEDGQILGERDVTTAHA